MRSALERGTLDGALMAYESYVSLQLADLGLLALTRTAL